MTYQKPCAYCGQTDIRLTKEHLWPRSLHKRLQTARGDNQHLFWLSRLDKEIETEPQLRDVCGVCNNGVLSRLDSYICSLWDQFFLRIHDRGDLVSFSYDYALLCRWLLKLCYNSARIHKFDEFVYPHLVPYILTGSPPKIEFRLFLQIVPPGSISVLELEEAGLPSNKPWRWEPDLNRVGFVQFSADDGRKKILRAVHLRSYSFFLAFFQPEAKECDINDFLSVFLLQQQGTKHILPGSNSTTLICDGRDAWESLQDARRKFVFNDSQVS